MATKDGSIKFTFNRGKDFPKYGGRLKFTLPKWVDTDERVFSEGNSRTSCSSPDLEKDQEAPAEN